MKTQSHRVNRYLLTAGCMLALGGLRVAPAAATEVTICHFPPGDPADVQVITVGAPSVPAHIAKHNDAVCPAGDSDCCFGGSLASVCTNIATDVNNCGGCGITCPAGATCTDGSCVAPNPCAGVSCPECQTCDPANGNCVANPDNTRCSSGTCCTGRCTETSFDPQNCGACGVTCGPDSCEEGQCCGVEPGESCTAIPCCAGLECQTGTCCLPPGTVTCYTDAASQCCSGVCIPSDTTLPPNAPGHNPGACQ